MFLTFILFSFQFIFIYFVFLLCRRLALDFQRASQSAKMPEHDYIALDDCIQASLRTLELAKHSQGNNSKALSQYEIESANVSLNQVIRTAETIKEKLSSHKGIGQNNDVELTSTAAPKHEGAKQPNNAPLPDASINSRNKAAADNTSVHESLTTGRRLSEPRLVPMEPTDVMVRLLVTPICSLSTIFTLYFRMKFQLILTELIDTRRKATETNICIIILWQRTDINYSSG